MRIALTGDGIANGTAITPANSGRRSGNKFDVATLGAGTSITADTSLSTFGAVRIQSPGGQNVYARYQQAGRQAGPNKKATLWLYFPAIPSSSTSVYFVANTSAQRCLEVRVTSAGLVQAYDSAGTARTATTTVIPTNQWFRIDLAYTTHATAGSLQMWYYANGTTLTETTPLATGLNLRTEVDNELYVGTVNSSASVLNHRIRFYFSDQGFAPLSTGFILSGWVGNTTQTSATVIGRAVLASSVRLAVSTSADLSSPVYSSAAVPDSNGVVRLNVSGLTANTRYYYGFEVDGAIDSEMNGEFLTHPGSGPVQFSFAAASCAANWSNAASFDAIRQYVGPSGKPPLFFQHLGDIHYINPNTTDLAVWQAALDQVLTTPRQSEFFRKIAVPYTWSDHDSSHSNTDGSGTGIPQAQQTYRNRVPHYPLSDANGIYYSFNVGDEVLFIVTDGRSFMDPIDKVDDANKTKLGSIQKQWLKDRLSDPNYLVKIWFHEDAWSNGPTYVGDDTWSAYATERTEIANYITTNQINVAYICGDLHVLAADDGTNVEGAFPVHVVSPLDQTAYVGNGTYTQGHYPLTDSVEPNRYQQFGIFDVDWTGTALTLTFKGMDSGGAVRVSQTRTWLAPTEPGDSPFTLWNGTTEAPLAIDGLWDGTTVQPLTFDQVTL